jgi:hypothetical protein
MNSSGPQRERTALQLAASFCIQIVCDLHSENENKPLISADTKTAEKEALGQVR